MATGSRDDYATAGRGGYSGQVERDRLPPIETRRSFASQRRPSAVRLPLRRHWAPPLFLIQTGRLRLVLSQFASTFVLIDFLFKNKPPVSGKLKEKKKRVASRLNFPRSGATCCPPWAIHFHARPLVYIKRAGCCPFITAAAITPSAFAQSAAALCIFA